MLDAEYHALAIESEDLFDYRALAIFSGGLVEGARLEKFLRAHLVHQRIEDMAVRYAAVAVDLKTGGPWSSGKVSSRESARSGLQLWGSAANLPRRYP